MPGYATARAVAVLLAVLAAIGPATAQELFPLGRWQWNASVDRITDAPMQHATLTTMQATIAGETWRTAAVLVFCAPATGETGLIFQWGGKAAGQKNITVDFRFDGQPGHRTKARYLNRSSQESRNADDVRRFLDGAARSERLYVRVGSDLLGESEAHFNARGGKAMVDRFRTACPRA